MARRLRSGGPLTALAAGLACQAAPSNAAAQATAEQAMARLKQLTADAGCTGLGNTEETEEIVVCSRRRSDAYRLPLPAGPDADERRGSVKGEVPGASPERLQSGPCGIFEGERRCGKAESARYGYGGGRDPLTVLIKLGTGLADPDADVAPRPRPPKPSRSERR